ncbi:MAG: ABC transporter permease [Christensenellales bacterium]
MNNTTKALGPRRLDTPLKRLSHNLRKYKLLYLMLVPTVAVLAVFNYYPLWGLRIAFYNYIPWLGFQGSKFVGLQNFKTLFSLPDFSRLVENTVVINLLKIAFGFPAPILFALLLNEVRGKAFKRTVQTISYLPHFVSWIIVSAILYTLINGSYGLINTMLRNMGIKPPVWYTRPDVWRGILVSTEVWKGVGFSSILYLAAISNINSEMYEAAVIDGATRMKQTLYITLPCILPTVVVMFILQIGGLMNGNFQQIFALVGSNTAIYKTVDTLDYYIYRIGIGKMNYSLGTTMGIFQSLISFALVMSTNYIANRTGDMGIW